VWTTKVIFMLYKMDRNISGCYAICQNILDSGAVGH
jgi:hypothetical protein